MFSKVHVSMYVWMVRFRYIAEQDEHNMLT